MSKTHEEIAADIVQAVITARGQALSGMGANTATVAHNALTIQLGKEAAVELYSNVLKAIKTP